jgi:hypothetical protein
MHEARSMGPDPPTKRNLTTVAGNESCDGFWGFPSLMFHGDAASLLRREKVVCNENVYTSAQFVGNVIPGTVDVDSRLRSTIKQPMDFKIQSLHPTCDDTQ